VRSQVSSVWPPQQKPMDVPRDGLYVIAYTEQESSRFSHAKCSCTTACLATSPQPFSFIFVDVYILHFADTADVINTKLDHIVLLSNRYCCGDVKH
jgi:hypothetical protein